MFKKLKNIFSEKSKIIRLFYFLHIAIFETVTSQKFSSKLNTGTF